MNIKSLQSQSTWRLILLTCITYAVYPVHYLKRLTKLINPSLDSEQRISDRFIAANFNFAYLSVVMLILSIFLPEGHRVEIYSALADVITGLLLLIWSFKIRNRLNSLRGATPGDKHWFHGFWTFILQYWYINYRINVSSDDPAELAKELEQPSEHIIDPQEQR